MAESTGPINLTADVRGALDVANVNTAAGTWNFDTLQVGGAPVVAPPSAGVDGDISTVEASDVADAGVSAAFAPADHVHAVSTAGSGDLAALTETGSAAAGSSTKLPAADHVHALPDFGREAAGTLIDNIRRRDAELHITPEDTGVVKELGGSLTLDVGAEGVPAMSVRVGSGVAYGANFVRATVAAGNQQVTITAADATNPRIDAIVLGQNGSLACRAGTPGAVPEVPSLTSGDTLLAYVEVAANETGIESTMIHDQRKSANPRLIAEHFNADSAETEFTLSRHIAGRDVPIVTRGGLLCKWVASAPSATYGLMEFAVENLYTDNGSRIIFGAAPLDGSEISVNYRG